LGGGVHVLDLGSGAGFPALPLKIWAPHIHLTLIESNHKKAAFLREAARALTLTNIDVFADRAETLSARLGPEFPKADIVTFRAVEKFDRTLPLAATFLSPTARLALLISSAQLPQLKAALPNLTWRITPIPQSNRRILSIGEESR
jgi:16S rRNA (guanine527-N7)-methyltransferase